MFITVNVAMYLLPSSYDLKLKVQAQLVVMTILCLMTSYHHLKLMTILCENELFSEAVDKATCDCVPNCPRINVQQHSDSFKYCSFCITYISPATGAQTELPS